MQLAGSMTEVSSEPSSSSSSSVELKEERSGDAYRRSSNKVVEPREEEGRKERQVEEGQSKESARRSLLLQDFITSHHLGLLLGLSVLLVLSGILIIQSSLARADPTDLLSGFMPPIEERLLLAVVGVLLIVSPFFVNSFVLKALRYEKDLRIRAQESTREAQLLQDILTHDIRNYNQVARLSAELIREEFGRERDADDLVAKLLSSIDGSTTLVDRAKMLGKVISDRDIGDRHPVNLLNSIKRSLELVISNNQDRRIITVGKLGSLPVAPIENLAPEIHEIEVLADDLLDEVFVNLFSNSTKYTEEQEVFIAIEINQEYDRSLRKKCWKVSIADTGKGIPDNLKTSLFSRYLDGAKGSGLGMSIVHALVVGRYQGRIEVRDRVSKDHTKGTLVEVWIPSSV